MSNKFWAIWRVGGNAPSKPHNSLQESIDEATRLVKKGSGEFYILEVIGIVKPKEIPVEFEYIYAIAKSPYDTKTGLPL